MGILNDDISETRVTLGGLCDIRIDFIYDDESWKSLDHKWELTMQTKQFLNNYSLNVDKGTLGTVVDALFELSRRFFPKKSYFGLTKEYKVISQYFLDAGYEYKIKDEKGMTYLRIFIKDGFVK